MCSKDDAEVVAYGRASSCSGSAEPLRCLVLDLFERHTSVTYTTTNLAKAGAIWDGVRWAVTLQLL